MHNTIIKYKNNESFILNTCTCMERGLKMKKTVFFLLVFSLLSDFIFAENIQDKIISKARTLIGTPYRIGGITPSGFDCSGLITYLYKPYIQKLPRVSRDMAKTGIPVRKNGLLPGDLVFFATGSSKSQVTHVALYIGQNSIIHSISNGPERGVVVSSLNAGYWKKRYFNSSRILNAESSRGKVTDEAGETLAENAVFAKGIYNGSLLNGESSGKGTLLMKNGDIYTGFFAGGVFEGSGTYTWTDGRSFSGNFKAGDFYGSGIMTMGNGAETKGRWMNGIFTPDAATSGDSKENEDKTDKIQKQNYMKNEDSPWNTYDGIVEGDFSLWFKKDMEAFEEWKKSN